ncbi:hypothetical protein [Nocardioides stalactiti]|uniref:hypothetical protein n=1 Tax=Nocardioides stalactiti TaxID=2755356 RepID=UPI00160397F0|nr:hypothetical protein [Nocardioides stalactiti]
MSTRSDLADQLLDAQVAFHLAQLRGKRATATAAELADELLDAVGQHQIADLVDAERAKLVIARLITTAPGSAAAAGLVELVIDVVLEGPATPYPLGELVDRDQVAELVDALLTQAPLLGKALDELADSPLIGAVASRFMGRIVGEVMATNKAVADKLPGLGALVSLGNAAAAGVVGAAGKGLDGLLGDTVGKSGAFAVRRLSKITVETLQDPTTREAVLQAWDVVAAEKVQGVGRVASRDELAGIIGSVHELAVGTLAGKHVQELVGVLVDGFFDRFGGYTPTELLEQLDLDRKDLRDDVAKAAPTLLAVLDESGDLERLLRARLAPFYDSPEVSDLLG